MNWIEIPKNAPELAVATYGRGLWILRDIWQLEKRTGDRGGGETLQAGSGHANGRGRPGEIRVRVKSAPASPITVDILDSSGAVINTSQFTGASD